MFLKNIILFTFLSISIYTKIFAQEKKEKFQFGLKGGINFAELVGKDANPDTDHKVGFSFGIFFNYKLPKNFKLQPEVIWSMQGQKTEDEGRYKISYVNIPIMFKWNKEKFYTEFGPQIGLLTINSSKSVPEEMRLENFETFDLSLNVGIGYEIGEDWAIGVRYIQGLTNLVEGMRLKNSVIYVGISYRIF